LQVRIEADLEREIVEIVEAAEAKLSDQTDEQRNPGETSTPSEPELPHSLIRG
jgi:hypothetical protein